MVYLAADTYEGYSSQESGKARIIIAKNKLGGRNESRHLWWDAKFVAFRPLSERRDDPRTVRLGQC